MVSDAASARARHILGTRPDGVSVAAYDGMVGIVAGYLLREESRDAEVKALRDRMGVIEKSIKPRVRVPAVAEARS